MGNSVLRLQTLWGLTTESLFLCPPYREGGGVKLAMRPPRREISQSATTISPKPLCVLQYFFKKIVSCHAHAWFLKYILFFSAGIVTPNFRMCVCGESDIGRDEFGGWVGEEEDEGTGDIGC